MSAVQAELYPKGNTVPTATWGLMELGGGYRIEVDSLWISRKTRGLREPELSVT